MSVSVTVVPVTGSTVSATFPVTGIIQTDWVISQDDCTVLVNGIVPDITWDDVVVGAGTWTLGFTIDSVRWPGHTYTIVVHVDGDEEYKYLSYFQTTQTRTTSDLALYRAPRTQLMANTFPSDHVIRVDPNCIGQGLLWSVGVELTRMYDEILSNRALPAWADPRIPVLYKGYLEESEEWQLDYLQGGEPSFRFPTVKGYSDITDLSLNPLDGNALENISGTLPTRLGLTLLDSSYLDSLLPTSVGELGAFEGFADISLPGSLFVGLGTTGQLYGFVDDRWGFAYVRLEGTNLGDYPIKENIPFAISGNKRTFHQFKTLTSAQFVGPRGVEVDLGITNSQPLHMVDLDIQTPMVNSEYSAVSLWDWETVAGQSNLLQKAYPNVPADTILRGEGLPSTRFKWRLQDTSGSDLVLEDLRPDLFRPWLYAVDETRFFIFSKYELWRDNKEMAEASPDCRYMIEFTFLNDNALAGEEFQVTVVPTELGKAATSYIFSVESPSGTTYLSQTEGAGSYVSRMDNEIGFKFPVWDLTAENGKSIFRLDITYADRSVEKVRRIFWVDPKRPLVQFDINDLINGPKRLLINHRQEPILITANEAYRVDLFYDYAIVDFNDRAVYSLAEIDGMTIEP